MHIPLSLSLPYSFAVSSFSSTVFIIPLSVTLLLQNSEGSCLPQGALGQPLFLIISSTLVKPQQPTGEGCSQGWEGGSWFFPQPCPDLLGDLGSLLRCQLQHLYHRVLRPLNLTTSQL